jgi:GT2 family glycosyltransferase
MKISVVVPSWNGMDHLEKCLESLLSQKNPEFEVVVVDNGSADGSADFVAAHYPQVQLIRNKRNLGFAGGCNVGLRAARGEVLVLLNQDVIVLPGWLGALADALADEQVGVAGAKLLEPDGRTLSHAGGYLEWPVAMGLHIGIGEIDQGQYDVATDVEYVTGASLAIRRNVLDRVGLLDERFYPAFFEDVDLCWRVRQAGWRVRYEPRAVALHDEASSTRHHWPSRHYYHYRNRLLFLFKHFTLSQILEEFIPAERERILRLPLDELRAGQAAITEILAMWSVASGDLLEAKGDVEKEKEENLLEALRMLRELIVYRQGGDPAFSRPKRPTERLGEPVGESEPLRPFQHGLTEALVAELETLWDVHERPFTSQVPILGRWIVALRNLWNSVATKWYVRPLLSQQVRFNGAVVRALLQLYGQDQALYAQDQALRRENQTLNVHYWDDDALLALLAEQCGALTERVVELEARLAQREEQFRTSEGKASE